MIDSSIPIGGSTGHCHESTAAIDMALQWLIETPSAKRPDRPLVPVLREIFGLTAVQACEAIREYRLQLARAT